jgi:hypothetical protein
MPRSNDNLYRRENRIFAFRYKDRAGKWREKYTGTTDRAEAKSAAAHSSINSSETRSRLI